MFTNIIQFNYVFVNIKLNICTRKMKNTAAETAAVFWTLNFGDVYLDFFSKLGGFYDTVDNSLIYDDLA